MSFLSEQENTNKLLSFIKWLLMLLCILISINIVVGLRVCHVWQITFNYMRPVPEGVSIFSGKLSLETMKLIKKEYKAGRLDRYLKPLDIDTKVAIRKMIKRGEL